MRRVLLVLAALGFASPALARQTCDPPCVDGAVCRDEGLCVKDVTPGAPAASQPKQDDPSTHAPGKTYTYDRFRIGAGVVIGLGFSPDGVGFAFGAAAALVVPFGKHFYLRPEIGGLYFQTSISDTLQTPSATAATYRETDHLLFFARPMIGYQFHPLVSVRVGPLLGYRLVSVEQGLCGSGLSRRTFGSAVAGGGGAVALHTMGADIALGVDAFTGTTHGFCDTTAGVGRGVLAHANDVGAQLTALATYLF